MAQRIAEAFREGVASAKPDYVKRPEVKIPPAEKKKPQESADAGTPDRAIQEGGSAAAAVGDKAAIALDGVVQLVKKAPAVMHKYAQAFREGAASVKPREGRERKEKPPQEQKSRPASEGTTIIDKVLHPDVSVTEILRGAVTALKPSPVRGDWQKIRKCRKRINALYIDIGCEAVNAWGNGPVETEKVAGLLDELRKNEEEIQKLMDHIAEVEAARKTDATRSQPAAKEIEVSPAAVPAPEPMAEAEAAPREEASAGAVQAQPEEPAAEHMAEAEVAPREEANAGADQARPEEPAAEHMAEAEAAPREEAKAGADQARPEEPAAKRLPKPKLRRRRK